MTKWSPSRHHFALARLVAHVMSRRPAPASPSTIYFIDRHQSAIENYVVAVWFLLSMTCFIAAALPLATPLALVAAFPLAVLAIQLPIFVTGLPFSNYRVNSVFLMLCGAAAALYFAAQPGWVRFVALTFLGTIALNAVAFMIVRICEE